MRRSRHLRQCEFLRFRTRSHLISVWSPGINRRLGYRHSPAYSYSAGLADILRVSGDFTVSESPIVGYLKCREKTPAASGY